MGLALKASLKAGINWAQFWRLTPFASFCIVIAAIEARREELEDKVTASYFVEYFARTEKLSGESLDKVIKAIRAEVTERKEQSEEEIAASIMGWLSDVPAEDVTDG